MNRLGLIPPEELSSDQKPLYDTISECTGQIPLVSAFLDCDCYFLLTDMCQIHH